MESYWLGRIEALKRAIAAKDEQIIALEGHLVLTRRERDDALDELGDWRSGARQYEGHAAGCICADCAGASLDTTND